MRLWQVGSDQCLNVFHHKNYGKLLTSAYVQSFTGSILFSKLLLLSLLGPVTCIQFNPMDENYFLSGSIDGKIRIWGVKKQRVVDWADIRDVITAISYRPDGKV